jgi:hypothetical protein
VSSAPRNVIESSFPASGRASAAFALSPNRLKDATTGWRPNAPRVLWRDASVAESSRQRRFVLLLAALLAPSALVAFTMAFWIIASDLRWTGEFFLTTGLFSHWQVWLCTAAILLLLSRLLDRAARRPGEFAGVMER